MDAVNIASPQFATSIARTADLDISQTAKPSEQILSGTPFPYADSKGRELKETVPVQTGKITTPPKSPEHGLTALHPAMWSQSVFAKIWGVALKGLQEVKTVKLPRSHK